MSRRRKLHYRRWYRYLWLEMRSAERRYERERRELNRPWRRDSSPLRASCGGLVAALIRSANSTRGMLGL